MQQNCIFAGNAVPPCGRTRVPALADRGLCAKKMVHFLCMRKIFDAFSGRFTQVCFCIPEFYAMLSAQEQFALLRI